MKVTGFKSAAHAFAAPQLSLRSTFNRPPEYTIWEMLKDILLSFMISLFSLSLPHFLKCAALHKDDVGKILPYYPIMKRTSESAAFICRQLVSCTIFILLWGTGEEKKKLLRDAALPSAGKPCRQSLLQRGRKKILLPLCFCEAEIDSSVCH